MDVTIAAVGIVDYVHRTVRQQLEVVGYRLQLPGVTKFSCQVNSGCYCCFCWGTVDVGTVDELHRTVRQWIELV